MEKYSLIERVKYRLPLLGAAAICIACILGIISSCSKGSDGHEGPTAPDSVTPQIIMLYGPGGLGDQGYNDCVLVGVQNFKKIYHNMVDMYQYSPGSLEEAERLLKDWLSLPASNIPALFVVGSSDYEALLTENLSEKSLTPNKRLLFFESANPNRLPVTTFQLSMYGASYLAGITAASNIELGNSDKDVLALLAHPHDHAIESAGRGFCDGFNSRSKGAKVFTEYLADDWTGYVSAQAAYQRMREWANSYSFIFPVAGGSNQGIYRYTREYTDAPLTAGMDVDQSGLSRNITGSVIKRIDKVIYDYMESWLITGELPESKVYGLASGYTYWLLSPNFEQYKNLMEEAMQEAISKEEVEL